MDIRRFLEKDVPECYFSMASTQGAMIYYMLYEAWAGEPSDGDLRNFSINDLPGGKRITDKLTELVKAIYCNDISDASALKEEVVKLRDDIKNSATEVATYTDEFRLYEYVLNRVKPHDSEAFKPINNDAAARDVLSAIFASGDNPQINENIKLALGQLPLRMTKSRFNDILDDSLRKYIDSDSEAFERELYMIRSSAGIYGRESDEYSILDELLQILRNVDYSAVNDDTFKSAEDALVRAVSILNDLSELYQTSEQVVNYLLIIMLTYPYMTAEDISLLSEMKLIVDEASFGLEGNTVSEMSENALLCMHAIEGRFEPIAEKLQHIQSKLELAYKGNLEDDIKDVLNDLDSCERLMSPSVFADLGSKEESILDEQACVMGIENLTNDLSNAFAQDSRPMMRARMAAVLTQLPIFFNSRTEVMNYVRESLDSCRDIYEKMISVRLTLDAINGTDNDK